MRSRSKPAPRPTSNLRPDRPVQHRQRASGNNRMLDALRADHTPLSNAFRHIDPTWRNYIYYANVSAQSGNVEMQRFMQSHNALPKSEQRTILPDKLCDLAQVDPADLIAAVAKELWSQKQSESVIVASMNHPKMVQATAFWGQSQADNNRDRELFMRLTGTLPDKKGTSVVINNNPQTANISQPIAHAGANGFKPMDQRILDMGKLLDSPENSNLERLPIFARESEPSFVQQENIEPED